MSEMVALMYEIRQKDFGYQITNGDVKGKIDVYGWESMLELLKGYQKLGTQFKVVIENAPRVAELERIVNHLMQK